MGITARSGLALKEHLGHGIDRFHGVVAASGHVGVKLPRQFALHPLDFCCKRIVVFTAKSTSCRSVGKAAYIFSNPFAAFMFSPF